MEQNIDSTLKVIEITAKEIVDRISANHAVDEENIANNNKDPSTNEPKSEFDTSKLGGARRLSSNNPSSAVISDGRKSSIQPEISDQDHGTGPGITPPQPVPGDNSMVQQLLTSVQNWIIDAHPQKLGIKNKNSLSLSKGITSEMHWVYSIESYLRTLDWSSQEVLGEKFSSQLVLWFKHFFHFKSYPEHDVEYNSVLPHWEIGAGLVALAQLVCHLSNPNLLAQGYSCFFVDGSFPVIYSSDEYLSQQIRFKLGLPNDCVKLIDTMNPDWVNILEQQIIVDSRKNLKPVMLLLNIGKNVRHFESGCKLAEKYKLWIHLYGANVLSYFCKRPELDQIGHSFTIDLTKWLQSPAVPLLTLYKRPENIDQLALELCGLSASNILSFSPWFLTQAVGWTKFLNLVDETIERGQFVLNMLQKFECLNIVPNWSVLSDGQIIISALSFRYKPLQDNKNVPQDQPDNEHPSAQYIETLNSWLYQIMERDLRDFLPVEYVYVEGYGWNILLDMFKTRRLSLNEKDLVVNIFENHMIVLQATVSQKLVFSRLVKASPELEWVEHEKVWAGLGAVRYIPKFNRPPSSAEISIQTSDGNIPIKIEDKISKIKNLEIQKSNLDVKENVNHLNAKIVDKLKVIDTAFSLGETENGDWCVQFGMVTLETDVAELVRLVVSSGEEIEESSEFLKKMSELVLQGIEKATLELKRESEEALWEEGILRKVPIVGTFVNWWSPPVKESGVRGRALNLAQGKVESTENIYKYHMQVEAFSPSTTTTSTSSNNLSHNSSGKHT